MVRKWMAAIVLALLTAGCATGDGTDSWQKGGDPWSPKGGPMRGSGSVGS